MTTSTRFTSADLEVLPQDNKRYEIIDGELFVSKSPHFIHQYVCDEFCGRLNAWGRPIGLAITAAGRVFAEDDDVVPDVLWTTWARLAQIVGDDGHFHSAPELVIEVLSPGRSNELRDREVKLKLYSRRGVDEFWIVDWRLRTVDAYRRAGDRLELVSSLGERDVLESPLLPGFSVRLSEVFSGLSAF